jgi:meiotically up-regulated gene 157 (Mug157) protein
MYTYIWFSFENSAVCELVMKMIVEPERPQMGISRMRNECCIT